MWGSMQVEIIMDIIVVQTSNAVVTVNAISKMGFASSLI